MYQLVMIYSHSEIWMANKGWPTNEYMQWHRAISQILPWAKKVKKKKEKKRKKVSHEAQGKKKSLWYNFRTDWLWREGKHIDQKNHSKIFRGDGNVPYDMGERNAHVSKKTVCLRFIHFTECKLNVNIVLLSLIKTCGYLARGCSSPFRLMCLHDT